MGYNEFRASTCMYCEREKQHENTKLDEYSSKIQISYTLYETKKQRHLSKMYAYVCCFLPLSLSILFCFNTLNHAVTWIGIIIEWKWCVQFVESVKVCASVVVCSFSFRWASVGVWVRRMEVSCVCVAKWVSEWAFVCMRICVRIVYGSV